MNDFSGLLEDGDIKKLMLEKKDLINENTPIELLIENLKEKNNVLVDPLKLILKGFFNIYYFKIFNLF